MLNKVLRKARSKKGFTLIELIVVIAILAVLAIIIVPRIVGFIGSAKQSSLDSNARMLYNTTSLVISQGLTLPGAGLKFTWDALGDDTTGGMAGFLDEWPEDPINSTSAVPAYLIVEIDEDGKIEVEDSNNVHLLGATIP